MARLLKGLTKEALKKKLEEETGEDKVRLTEEQLNYIFAKGAFDRPRPRPRPGLGDQSPTIEDWSHTIIFTPSLILRPVSADHLVQLMNDRLATDPNSTFTVMGSYHSSSLIFENDVVIDVTAMPIKLEWSEDFTVVTASTNITLRIFLVILSRQGRALPATGGTDEQTLAGVIGTNTAPATQYQTIYSGLKSLKYVGIENGKAVLKELEVDAETPFIPNLGALGILLEVTFNTVPDQYYTTIQTMGDVNQILKDLSYNYQGQDYPFWRIDWIPKRQDGLVWAARQIPLGPNDDPNGDYPPDQITATLKKAAFLNNPSPFLSPLLSNVYWLAAEYYKYFPETVTGPMRNMLPVDRYTAEDMYCSMAEWSFLPSDATKVKGIVENYFNVTTQKWPNLPVEIELVQRDQYPMSAWNHGGSDVKFLVKFNFMYLTPNGTLPDHFRDEVESHLQGLWNELLSNGIDFKAHWGKINFTTPDDVAQKYQWDKFKPYVVPSLLNPYLKARFPPL